MSDYERICGLCGREYNIEQKLISEFVDDLKKEIEYIKTINNYQPWGDGFRQCIPVETLEKQLKEHIIEKWEAMKK